mmetsp:Transcript_31698/g.101364  ORF Transcript_31698/g.101364 Transcript_31698/m.101364 type:complete len:260 (-) Transcript_31698:816-1595(-)
MWPAPCAFGGRHFARPGWRSLSSHGTPPPGARSPSTTARDPPSPGAGRVSSWSPPFRARAAPARRVRRRLPSGARRPERSGGLQDRCRPFHSSAARRARARRRVRRGPAPGNSSRSCPMGRSGRPCECWACQSPSRTRWSPPSRPPPHCSLERTPAPPPVSRLTSLHGSAAPCCRRRHRRRHIPTVRARPRARPPPCESVCTRGPAHGRSPRRQRRPPTCRHARARRCRAGTTRQGATGRRPSAAGGRRRPGRWAAPRR